MAPTWQALLDGARYVDERLVEIFDEVQPDAIVEDNVCAFPAIPASGRPWVRIVSCNPLELKDPELPPPYTGLPIDDRSAWDEYRAEYRRVIDEMQGELQRVLHRARRAAAPRRRDDPRARPGSTSTSIRARSTTRARSRSAGPGTTSSRASAPPTPSGRPAGAAPTATAR